MRLMNLCSLYNSWRKFRMRSLRSLLLSGLCCSFHLMPVLDDCGCNSGRGNLQQVASNSVGHPTHSLGNGHTACTQPPGGLPGGVRAVVAVWVRPLSCSYPVESPRPERLALGPRSADTWGLV
jgi:hypothetical protein